MLNNRAREEDVEDDIDANSWLTTYSDTITLLLTFFILLYSMSVIDNEKLKQVSGALHSELTGRPLLVENIDEVVDGVEPMIPEQSDYESLVEKVNIILSENDLQDAVKIREEDRGVALQLEESILFDQGNADLKEGSKTILDVISDILPKLDNQIVVEGHTDNVPINSSRYASNWELSTARSVNVLRYFVEQKNFEPTRLSATGYGEYRPLVENTSDENKSINRRVDIVIIEQKETDK
ncbi:chemotaxis protein MotB [Romboutsia weinsteinii]|uniref:Chemotaxis protein MotB n=1 Tax=Romboutsia weinsteinii TaxID=2020949 RepID=A0A371J844_9FIRM|nr:OmpA family protein [Romboutsia weinsteinii]RDY28932.1 chemotaxis protein MotB [Romboutsia weinsteinii]